MRVAYVTETYPPEVNGVALTVERSVGHLRRGGNVVLLVRPRQAFEAQAQSADEWRAASVPIPMYRDLRIGLAMPSRLRRRFEAFEVDVVHVATEGPLGRAAVAAARSLGVPVTSDFRTNFHVYCRHYGVAIFATVVERYLRAFHNRTSITFVPSRALRDELSARGFERLEVLARGVDARLFAPARRSAELRRAWGASDGSPVLLYVGRLAAEKNVPLALRAFEAVRARVPDARMVVVGDGPLRARLQAANPAVHFAGLQRGEALAAHFASGDVFVFPSLSETYGNVTLEALASGLGVVAFSTAAAGELVSDDHNGLLAAPGDEAAFVAQACRAAADRQRLASIRRLARETALAIDWEPVSGAFETRLRHLARTAGAVGDANLA